MPILDARRLSPRTRVLLVVGVLVVLVLGWLITRALLARQALDDARGAVSEARTALLELRVDDAQAAIADANDDTERARGLTGDLVWRGAGAIPWVGNSFDAVHGVAEVSSELTGTVLPQALEAVRAVDPTTLRRPDGTVNASALADARPGLEQAARGTEQLLAQARALPDSGLVRPVRSARQDLVEELDQLAGAARTGADAVTIAPRLLGADRPRRYLVLVQQSGESRGTGGLIGGYAELVADQGRISAGRIGSNADLRREYLLPPSADIPQDFVERYSVQGTFGRWQNINVSPDLPVVAKVIEQRWRNEGGSPLDGVITADPVALSLLLAGSDPIRLGTGQELRPEQLVDFFSVGQYLGVPVDDQVDRKEQLDDVARVVVQRLTRGGGDDSALVGGLVRAIRSGHVHLTSDDPVLAPVLRSSGFDGGLPTGDAPLAYPVVFNASGGKLDTWLTRRLEYRAASCDGPRRRTVLTTTLVNEPPPGLELPPYVTLRLVDGELGTSTTGRVGLMVYGTRGSKLLGAELDGVRTKAGEVIPGTEAGLPVWLVYLDTPPNQARTLTLYLDEPSAPGEPRTPEQPLVRDQETTVSVPTC